MTLSVKGLAFASGLTWGFAVLFVGVINIFWPWYGTAFLQLLSSIYPKYQAQALVGAVIIATGYAVVDGALAGAIFGWLYNLCAR